MDKSLFKRGGERGVYMGFIFVMLFACWVASGASAVASLLCIGIFVAVPIVAYRFLGDSMRRHGGALTFSALWLEGTLMFIGGALFLAVASFMFFRWIDPDFVMRQLKMLVEVYSQDESLRQYADIFRRMMELKMVPRPIEMAMSMMWMTSFSGAMLSMIIAGILRVKYRNRLK